MLLQEIRYAINNDFHEISDFESKTISVPVTDLIYFLFQKYQHPNTLGKLHYHKTAEFFNWRLTLINLRPLLLS